jgi:hypothetical protein
VFETLTDPAATPMTFVAVALTASVSPFAQRATHGKD